MRVYLLFVCTLVANISISAQEPKLTIGDTAPALDIEHWIPGHAQNQGPVDEFQPGIVYAVEFWGTWCPPCIASMPHLAETQTKYGYDKLRLISISTEEPSVIKSFLERKVPGEEKTYKELTSVYSVVADPDRSAYQDYLAASNGIGVPMVFLVGKSGVVEWAGHPTMMDNPLEQIMEDKWDREKYAVEYKRTQQLQGEVRRLSLFRTQHFNEPELVLKEIEKALEQLSGYDPSDIQILKVLRVRSLVESKRDKDAEDEIKRMIASAKDSLAVGQAASILMQLPPTSKVELAPLAKLAIQKLKTAPSSDSLKNMPTPMQEMARGQEKMIIMRLHMIAGDKEKAVALAETAIKEASNDQMKQAVQQILKQLQSKPLENRQR